MSSDGDGTALLDLPDDVLELVVAALAADGRTPCPVLHLRLACRRLFAVVAGMGGRAPRAPRAERDRSAFPYNLPAATAAVARRLLFCRDLPHPPSDRRRASLLRPLALLADSARATRGAAAHLFVVLTFFAERRRSRKSETRKRCDSELRREINKQEMSTSNSFSVVNTQIPPSVSRADQFPIQSNVVNVDLTGATSVDVDPSAFINVARRQLTFLNAANNVNVTLSSAAQIVAFVDRATAAGQLLEFVVVNQSGFSLQLTNSTGITIDTAGVLDDPLINGAIAKVLILITNATVGAEAAIITNGSF